jgi:hypothetical protein
MGTRYLSLPVQKDLKMLLAVAALEDKAVQGKIMAGLG